MAKEISPSAYLCDCGHMSEFFLNTIREIKTISQKKKVHLGDSEPDEHTIVFYKGKMVDIICPKQRSKYKDKQMMKTKTIPKEVKKEVDQIVENFNKNNINSSQIYYSTRYRKQFLYVDLVSFISSGPVCRLEYTGDMNQWEFAIYKYSKARYDPDECFFPGINYVDGTIEGALKAVLEAYPP